MNRAVRDEARSETIIGCAVRRTPFVRVLGGKGVDEPLQVLLSSLVAISMQHVVGGRQQQVCNSTEYISQSAYRTSLATFGERAPIAPTTSNNRSPVHRSHSALGMFTPIEFEKICTSTSPKWHEVKRADSAKPGEHHLHETQGGSHYLDRGPFRFWWIFIHRVVRFHPRRCSTDTSCRS